MPRILLPCALVLLASGCFFEAKYPEGVLCGDGDKCPSGLTCHQGARVSTIPIDMPPDMMMPPAALTCADPGVFSGSGTVNATTVGTTSKMSSLCGGVVQNGPDRVYRIMMSGQQLRVDVQGGRTAYVIAACVESPSTPACLGNTPATMGNPITVTPAIGPAFVVVDDPTAAAQSAYTLTLTVL